MATNNFLYSKANDLRELVELNDYLKTLYRDDGLVKFPSIVILGAQSDGKTSLIENMTNLNLPRGTGIQTRVPTEIQLRTAATNHYTIKYRPMGSADFKIVEFNEETLEEKMRTVQREVTGSDSKVVDDLITLTIERPDLIPLTIVDLPGFIVQRVSDEENDNEIEHIMKNMYIKYISNEQNLIVCCINATNDVETSSVLKLCLENDVSKRRIVLAVTKIDLRTSGGYENYRKAANKFGLKKIFFSRNKTDEERESKVKLEEVRDRERKFISGHKELKTFPDDCKGIIALRDFMVEIQKEMIIPSIRQNYLKLIDFYKSKIKEQELNGKLIEKPGESREFIEQKINDIGDELNYLYYDLNTKIQTDNFYQKNHLENETSKNEVQISGKKIMFSYDIIRTDNGIQITFSQGVKEHVHVELLGIGKQKTSENIDLEHPVPIQFDNVDFTIYIRLLSDKDFVFFKNTVDNIYASFKEQYGLDYFLSKNFVQVYENHEKAINTTNNLPDRDFSELAESILFKDLVPKLTYEIQAFKEFSIKFAQQIFILRICSRFKGFPNLRTLLSKKIEEFFVQPIETINEVVEILCENCFKTNTNDPMYHYKVDVLKDVLERGEINDKDDFLTIVCGNHDYAALREVYQSNPKVYQNAIRVWSYVSNIFPPLKDNVIKSVQNHLIQIPLKDFPDRLKKVFDDKFFDEANIAKMMRPNAQLLKNQKNVMDEIKKAADALDKIKNLPRKYPTMKREFDFVDERELDNLLGGR